MTTTIPPTATQPTTERTCSLTPGQCHAWMIPVRPRPEWIIWLDARERERLNALGPGYAADILVTSRAAQRLIGSRYLGLPAQSLRINRVCGFCGALHGRPRFEGADIDYSVSHTKDWLLFAVVGQGLVGADIDRLDPGQDPEGLAAVTLSPSERRSFERLPGTERAGSFLSSWTRKEAAMKLTGHGLAAVPSRVDVSGPQVAVNGVPDWPDTPVHLSDLQAPAGHTAALATTVPLTDIRVLTLPESWAR